MTSATLWKTRFLATAADAGFVVEQLHESQDEFERVGRQLSGRSVALFLDFDGTLTPIVRRPELARLDDQMRALLRWLAACVPVAVVSGRDRADVEKLVGVEGIVYAGSHGFDIAGPGGLHVEHRVGEEFAGALGRAEALLHESLDRVEGAQIERKRLSIAVHFRNVEDGEVERVERAVDRVVQEERSLRRSFGKKVFEIQPNTDWNKGKAVLWLLDALRIDTRLRVPVYVGDDVTDEDAFEALKGVGIGIVVGAGDRPSAAAYRLGDVGEVKRFLEWLGRRCRGSSEPE